MGFRSRRKGIEQGQRLIGFTGLQRCIGLDQRASGTCPVATDIAAASNTASMTLFTALP